ncbi:MAG: Eco57I restriction-modification methylase domain-containing protein, partial [bacterium]
MCRESLRLYLAEKLGEDSRKEKILNLLLDKKEHEFDYKNDRAELNPYKARLIEALDNLKIIDPACGSGAFPMGILQILVSTYARLDGRLDSYKTKKGIISENIYGVDIEPTAIEISRLRIWLSLVVDIELKNSADNSGIEPLPNLDFKFICANSLIPLKEISQLSRFDAREFEKSLKSLQEQYFTSRPSKKKELQGEFQKLLGRNIFNSNRTGISERQQQLESYQPFDSESVCSFFDTHFMFTLDGFDIVIGNPPYLESRHKNFSQNLKQSLSEAIQIRWGKQSSQLIQRGSDLLIYFFELSCSLIREAGTIVFITQNSWLDTDYGKLFQQFLISKTNVLGVIDSDFKYFDTANTNTVITLFQGNKVSQKNEIVFRNYHQPFDKEPFQKYHASNDIAYKKGLFTESIFKQHDDEIKNYKWGVLLSSGQDFIELIKLLSGKGFKLNELSDDLQCSIGQGLNIDKDYIIDESKMSELSLDHAELLPFFTNDDGAPFIITQTKNYLYKYSSIDDNIRKKLENNNLKIYEPSKTRQKAALIMPRGINRYYCAINECNAFSSSFVEIYTDAKNDKVILNLWLFLNSSIGWLIREISGRKNLGGGLLKSEASDLKNFPIYFDFKEDKLIKNLVSKLSKREAQSPLEEIYSPEHQLIDSIVFSYLQIDEINQKKYIDYLYNKISQ